jgi:hypothetical protein
MERLPYIDEIMTNVRSNREQTWPALLGVLRGSFSGGAAGPFGRVLGLVPARAAGAWGEPGSAVPGFTVASARRPERLELRGRHRFSTYTLIIEVDDLDGDASRVRARTYATFPGVKGRAYRALVIGSGAHRVVTRRLLGRVASRAAAAR